jgi:hypothetical protein
MKVRIARRNRAKIDFGFWSFHFSAKICGEASPNEE